MGLGATFDQEVWQSIGSVIGKELRALWLHGVGEVRVENRGSHYYYYYYYYYYHHYYYCYKADLSYAHVSCPAELGR